MTWFVASVVSCIEKVSAPQDEYPVFEDFYLIEASSQEELDRKVRSIADLVDKAGDCRYEGHAAKQKFAGVRKIRSIYNEPPKDLDADPPGDGTELSHSYFVASTKEDVAKFASGQVVRMLCVDDE